MSTLWLEYWVEDEDFHLYAENEEQDQELTLEGQAEKILAQFKSIYGILEEKQTRKEKELQSTLQALGKLLIDPFAEFLKDCDLVRVIVDDDVVRCAFDLLPYENKPLFLQRKVCYQVDEGEGEDEPKIKLESALIIADLSADPEKACFQVSKLIKDSQYVEVADATLKMIAAAAEEVDTLLISAHGELDEENSGGIYLDDETLIEDNSMGKQEAWIVYCDSCQQGVNMDYLDAFQEDSDIQYYLAPIISNDAGDLSTRTMVWFYEGVLKHGDPILALFETRKRLYEYYQTKEKLDLITTLNKAFAFRIYETVETEDDEE